MPTELFKVESFNRKTGTYMIVYRGDYDRCFRFYSENKEFYRARDKFLRIKINVR